MAGRLKTGSIVGMDIDGGCLRIVEIGLINGLPVLTRAVSATIGLHADTRVLARSIRQTLAESAIEAATAAVCLPSELGFVRCLPRQPGTAPAKETDEQSIVGWWNAQLGDKAVTVEGAVKRRAAFELVQAAQQAGLEVVAAVLAQVASAAALGMLEKKTHPRQAGFVIENDRVRFALAESYALLACRSAPLQSDQSAESGRHLDILDKAAQIYRAVQLGEPESVPAQISVIADARDEPVVDRLGERLGVSVQRVYPGQEVGLTIRGPSTDSLGNYSVAVGGALTGMGHTQRKMDLLSHLKESPSGEPFARRRVWISLVALVVLAMVGVATVQWVQKQRRLNELEQKYQAVRNDHRRKIQAQITWDLIRPWVSVAGGGQRTEHLKTLDTITDLFPGPDEAYVTMMTIGPADRETGVREVSLTGRAANSDIMPACRSRLEDSGRFRATLGKTDLVHEKASDYPATYSMKIIVKAEQDVRTKN